MPSSTTPCLSVDLVHAMFDYQRIKRLHLLMDQLLWSFNQPVLQTQLDAAQPYLADMVKEAKDHILCLDKPPGRSLASSES